MNHVTVRADRESWYLKTFKPLLNTKYRSGEGPGLGPHTEERKRKYDRKKSGKLIKMSEKKGEKN